ncbi:putative Ig domain-containing protein [Gaopeijia maritima]|uniref:putative Ig domain-containing protein n=1 Tax=Gaopeijia maritima TaxID=3119007 RepID=UPI00326A5045
MLYASRRLGAVFFAAASAVLVVACGGDGSSGPDPLDAVSSVSVSPGTATLDLGTTLQLAAAVRNGRDEPMTTAVSWSSSDPTVATVDASGLVRALNPGSVTVTARAEGVSGTAQFDTRDPNPPLAPSDVRATPVSDTEVDVSWSDNSNSEQEHVILREVVSGPGAAPSASPAEAGGSRFGGDPAQVAAEVGRAASNETTFRDSGLQPGTTYRYEVRACNDAGCSGDVPSGDRPTTHPTLTVDLPDPLPDAVVGEPYEESFGSSGPPAIWSLGGGTLPTGIELAPTGSLSGTPTEAGTFSPTITAQGGGQLIATALTLTVLEPPTVVTAALPTGVRGRAYATALQAEGGDGSYTWSLLEGSLPPGVALASNGTFAGTPVLPGSFDLRVQVASAGFEADAWLTIDIFNALALATTVLPQGVQDTSYDAQLVANGGDGSYEWSLVAGTLPDGLALDVSGRLTGTPTTLGSQAVTLQVTSGDGQTATGAFTLVVSDQIAAPTVATSSLADAAVGVPYAGLLEATDGDGSYSWQVIGGSLPAGVALDAATGVLSGTPAAAGTAVFTVRVTSASLNGTAALSITVVPALEITTASLPSGVEGAAYATAIATSGGDGAPSFEVVSGALPAGLTLDEGTGAIQGTPSAAGTSNFTVQASNELGQSAQRALSIAIHAPLAITTASLPDAQVSISYNQSLTASGGDGSTTWTLASGSLPAGMSLAANGTISGAPNSAGSSTFTVRATSGDGQTATAELTIDVAPTPPSIATNPLPNGTVGAQYTRSISVSGGDGSYDFEIIAGALPDGLSLGAANGLITGVPSAEGDFDFTVQVTSAGLTDAEPFSITIEAAAEQCVLAASQPGFDIQLCYAEEASPTVQAAFTSAVARWEGLITGDLADIVPNANAHTSCLSGRTLPQLSGTIDDLVIFVVVEPIDGEFGILGSAGPCYVRNGDLLTSVGTMRFDSADLDRLNNNGQLENVILHEMGHVLGIGTLWGYHGLIQETATPGETDPSVHDTHFTGAAAIAAFDAAGGAGRASAKVPVQNVGNQGSINGHWRETVMDNELMTPFLDGGANPLSAISVGSVGDLGYTVNAAGADGFAVPFPDALLSDGDSASEHQIHMIDDILDMPIRLTDESGTVVRVIPPRGGGN